MYLFSGDEKGKGKHLQSSQPIWGPSLLERLVEGSQSSEKSAKCNETESQRMPTVAGPIEMPGLNACMPSHCWSHLLETIYELQDHYPGLAFQLPKLQALCP